MNTELKIRKWKPIISQYIKNSYLIDVFCLYMEYIVEQNTDELESEFNKILSKIKDKSNFTEVKTFINIYTGDIEYRTDNFTILNSDIELDKVAIIGIFSEAFYNYLIEIKYIQVK